MYSMRPHYPSLPSSPIPLSLPLPHRRAWEVYTCIVRGHTIPPSPPPLPSLSAYLCHTGGPGRYMYSMRPHYPSLPSSPLPLSLPLQHRRAWEVYTCIVRGHTIPPSPPLPSLSAYLCHTGGPGRYMYSTRPHYPSLPSSPLPLSLPLPHRRAWEVHV